ncbi:hypothetical protein PoB_006006500 [Plakobranchus ocellatus]|uniref:Uncharacterized protein n=1 Tax=Plakobranchus ocellatus TaxID=259542 RepID=A0AAV4CNZ1_9GAST|nr:hypothetical protein PoB_006006500 [Plakobranchus ocellatus]
MKLSMINLAIAKFLPDGSPKCCQMSISARESKSPKILLHRCQQEGDETFDLGSGGDHRARNKLLEHLITVDETWLQLSTPKTKRNSMTWKYPSSPVTKKVQSLAIGNKNDDHRVLGLTWNDPFKYSAKRRECQY